MLKYSLGLDISNEKFDACLSVIDDKQDVKVISSRRFSNNNKGFKLLLDWIHKNQRDKVVPLVICMEATGVYYEQCALYLFNQGFSVSIILPNKAKKYLLSLGLKSKNDTIDAKGLSRMGAEQKLEIWQPMGTFFYLLRGLTRQLQTIQELKTMVKNQLHATELGMYELKFVIKEQKKLIETYDKLIAKLNMEIEKHLKSNEAIYAKVKNMISVKGIGLLTVAVILAETNGFELFKSTSQLVSYCGLDAVENQSGSHQGKTRISKKGNSRIRRSLFMPAFCAVKDKESIFYKLYERIFERSNIKMKAYVAVQKKLLVIMYTLWKRNEKFKPNNNNSRDEEQATSSPLTIKDKKIVPTKVALNKVINSVDESQFDSSPYLQS
jgi:transposase